MDSNLPSILEALRSAKATQNVDEFLRLSELAIQQFPQERKVQKFLESAKQDYVHAKLGSELLKNLEEKHDWRTMQAMVLKLLHVFPESKEVQKILKTVENKIVHQSEEEQKNYLKESIQKIETLVQEGHLDDAEHACYELLSKVPQNPQLLRLLARIQKQIEAQIDSALGAYFNKALPLLSSEYASNKAHFVKI